MSFYRDNIRHRLTGKPHLLPVFSNVYHIPERLKAMDSNLFVVFNVKSQRYEVHSLANKGHTFGFLIPFRELDARAEHYARKLDLRTRGDLIYREIDEHNERLERSNKRQKQNDFDAAAREIRPLAKKVAYGY